jgi:hypothetical protein
MTGDEVQELGDSAAMAPPDDPVGVIVPGQEESRPSRGSRNPACDHVNVSLVCGCRCHYRCHSIYCLLERPTSLRFQKARLP